MRRRGGWGGQRSGTSVGRHSERQRVVHTGFPQTEEKVAVPQEKVREPAAPEDDGGRPVDGSVVRNALHSDGGVREDHVRPPSVPGTWPCSLTKEELHIGSRLLFPRWRGVGLKNRSSGVTFLCRDANRGGRSEEVLTILYNHHPD